MESGGGGVRWNQAVVSSFALKLRVSVCLSVCVCVHARALGEAQVRGGLSMCRIAVCEDVCVGGGGGGGGRMWEGEGEGIAVPGPGQLSFTCAVLCGAWTCVLCGA